MGDAQRRNDKLPQDHAERCDEVPAPGGSASETTVDECGSPISAESPPHDAEPTYSIYEAIADSIEQITGDPFPEPFTGDHDIEYWISTGSRLVPAPPEVAERLRKQEARERAEYRRLHSRQQLRATEHRLR